MVQGIQSQSAVITTTYSSSTDKTSGTSVTTETTGSGKITDTVTLSQESTVTGTGSTDVMAEFAESQKAMMRQFVTDTLRQQGLSLATVDGVEIDITSLSQEDAAALVAEDGYFGAEQTSDRIVSFAIAVSGGDTTKLEEIMAGIEQGYAEAEEAWGDTLPDLCYDTYDMIVEKLNSWANDSPTAASAETPVDE